MAIAATSGAWLLGHLAGLVHAAERHRRLAEPHRDQRALVDELPRDGPRQASSSRKYASPGRSARM
jgi:hypothetical protein